MPQPIVISGFLGGLNTGTARDRLALGQSPDMQNFTVKDGVARKRTGYVADNGSNWTDDAIFLHGHHYQDGVSGKKRFWGFGTTTGDSADSYAHYKSTATGDWSADKGTSVLSGTGKDVFFTTTEIVELSDDYKNYLIVCQADTKRVGGSFYAVVYTNEPETSLAKLEGGDGYHDDDSDPGANIHHYAKAAVAFADHLLLLHTNECTDDSTSPDTYTEFFQRVRWSDLAHFTASADWDDVNTDGAGYQDLRTEYGAILAGSVLGNNVLVIFLEKAVYNCFFTGVSTAPFHFEPKITGAGLYAWRLHASDGEAIYYASTDRQIYAYYGGKNRIPIGDPIRTEFFDNINTGTSNGYRYADRAWAHYLRELNAVMFAIPTGSSDTLPTLFYVYFIREGRWEKWDYADVIAGMGDYDFPESSSVVSQPVFSDGSGNIYRLDYSSTDDGNTAIDAYITTPTIIMNLKNKFKPVTVWFEASGDGAASSVQISVSTDDGATYTDGAGGTSGSYQSVTVGSTWDRYHVDMNVTGYGFRLKFRNNTAGQKLLLGRIVIDTQDMGQI